MEPIIASITPTTKIDVIHALLDRYGFISLPVVEDGYLRGIITTEDVGRAARGSARNMTAREIMTKRVEVVSEEESLYTAWMRMTRRGFKHLPVISTEQPDQIIGEVTLATIGRVLQVPTRSQEHDDRVSPAAELRAAEDDGHVSGVEPEQEKVSQ